MADFVAPTKKGKESAGLLKPLYKDEYVTLFSDRVVLNLYYFPYGSKTIKIGDIEWVKTAEQMGLGLTGLKSWGMPLKMIWWACNLGRELTSSLSSQFVIKVKGARIKCGFTVENPSTFTKLLAAARSVSD